MSPLERAAQAISDLQQDDGFAGSQHYRHISDERGQLRLHWEAHMPTVRAVLQAIREPSEGMKNHAIAGAVLMEETGDPTGIWQAMIDAAMEEA